MTRRAFAGLLALVLWFPLTTASAQLNENCTISILNRTANVRADGSWRIDNVPANFGQVRARATCVENGVTRSGQSDFFTLEASIVNGFNAEIPIGVVDPIPESLTVTAPTDTLTSEGATTQLAVTATFSDGSTADLTAAGTGTNYTTTNPAIATVGADGLVTAVSSGTVLVSAINEGALGFLQLQVSFSGDSDGDGIPDDVELANGLDPNNPVDALEDSDGDGLTNGVELANGLDPNDPEDAVADLDGDGLTNAQEIALGTGINNPDSDDDKIPDGLEVQTGSDPTDPASFNLAQALASLEVTPFAFVLTVNTIIGEAFQQLTVTGHLQDGTTINLTPSTGAKPTAYTSSDTNICVAEQDGRIAAGLAGTCTVTASNSGFSAAANTIVQSFAPTALSDVDIPGFANNVDVSGNFAYLAAGSGGLQVVDVSDRGAPRIVASQGTPGNANDVKVVANTVFVADGSAGLQVLDITDPLDPEIIGVVDTPGTAQDVVVSGNLAFVADGSAGLQVIDISDPTAPDHIGSADTPGMAKGVDVAQAMSIAVVADGTAGIQVVDISDPMNPSIMGGVDTGDARDVVLAQSGSFGFVADFSSSFTAVDLRDPANPVVRSSTPQENGGLLMDVALAGQFGFGADVFFVNGVPVVDISVPENPVPRAILDFSSYRDDNGTGIAVDSRFVYLTASRRITENGSTGDTRLYIGQYLFIEDTAGIAPTVRVTTPVHGDAFVEGTMLVMTVDAEDDFAVAGVNAVVDGEVVSTKTAAPYEFTLDVPLDVTSLTLGAAAVDFGSNVAFAPEVVVTVTPDPPPTVVISSPEEGAVAIEGDVITINADIQDNGQVASARLTVNGVNLPLETISSLSTSFVVPRGITELNIEVAATDNLGRTTAVTRTVSVIPDPLTTVTGIVVDPNGLPAEGAVVTTAGDRGGLTTFNGSFTVANVPTILGDIEVRATLFAPDGTRFTGRSSSVAPVRGGTTNVGNIGLNRALNQELVGNITTVAGTGVAGFSGDGDLATDAQLNLPRAVAMDATGNLFIADISNHRIRKVQAATGIISTVAGTGEPGFSGDGGPATGAQLNQPIGVAVDCEGNLIVVDFGNLRVRRIDAATETITTVAGNGTFGSAGDGGLAIDAQLRSVNAVAVDHACNLYLAEFAGHRIRQVDAETRIITTVAGTGSQGYSGDGGPATQARLNHPTNVAVDTDGNVYIADRSNQRIRRVDAENRTITTVLGGPGFSLSFPDAVTVDKNGDLFIGTRARILRVDADTGAVAIVAGTGQFGFSGDGGPATAAQLSQPFGIAVEGAGNLFIADSFNYRVRAVRLGIDQDGDGLVDKFEQALGTDPDNPDSDDDGLSDGEELLLGEDPLTPDTTPPTVTLNSPGPGATVIERETVTIAGTASDNGFVTAIEVFLDSTLVGSTAASPFEFMTPAPVGVSSVKVRVEATDTNGNVGAAELTLSVTPDPLTTVIGTVVDALGKPVNGASATALNDFSATTDADGSFLIAGVPTVLGNISVEAAAPTAGFPVSGRSAAVVPVAGGTTDVGQIVIRERPLSLTDGTGVSDQAMPAVDRDGNLHVVWVDDRTGNEEIFYTMLSPAGVARIDDTQLSTGAFVRPTTPAIAADSQRHVHVVWSAFDPSGREEEIFHTEINPALDDQDGSPAADAAIVLVDDHQISIPAHDPQLNPRLAVDSRDHVHVVWFEEDEAVLHYVQLNSDGSTAVADQIVFPLDEYFGGGRPAVAVDSMNDVHVVWSGSVATFDTEIVYGMLDGETGATLIDATTLTRNDGSRSKLPSVSIGPEDEVTVVFQDLRFKLTGGETEIFMLRIDPSRDDQNGDAADASQIRVLAETPLTPNDGIKSNHPAATSDIQGKVHVTYYHDWSPRGPGDLRFRVVDASGAPAIEEQQLTQGRTATTTEDLTLAHVAVDDGSTYITWTDESSGQPQVFLHRLNLDPDGDGLGNALELLLGTQPDNPDTDGDGVPDGEEDGDQDGLPDRLELLHGLDPNDGSDAVGDFDDDGLSNLQEIALRTEVRDDDSDDDLLADGEEVNTFETDPLNPDSDGGGVTDGEEVLTSATDPNDPQDDDYYDYY